MGERLAISGINVVYGMSEFPTNGPVVTDVSFFNNPDSVNIDITFDQSFEYNQTETNGFYGCCFDKEFDFCNSKWNEWRLVSTFCCSYC